MLKLLADKLGMKILIRLCKCNHVNNGVEENVMRSKTKVKAHPSLKVIRVINLFQGRAGRIEKSPKPKKTLDFGENLDYSKMGFCVQVKLKFQIEKFGKVQNLFEVILNILSLALNNCLNAYTAIGLMLKLLADKLGMKILIRLCKCNHVFFLVKVDGKT
jgi:hypothetical protein